MESAIPPGLRCPRLHDRRIEDDFVPPFMAWTGEGELRSTPTVMAYLGVQTRAENGAAALEELRGIVKGLACSASHYDLAHFRDVAGYDNFFTIAYWTDAKTFDEWRSASAIWWNSQDREAGQLGYFREIFTPTRDRFETLFSSERLEGVGLAMGQLWGPVQEHGYWGSMRDRLPLSQTDRLRREGDLRFDRVTPGRIVAMGHQNLAMIRSGQDWTATVGDERALYLEKMEPIFRDGMTFLTQDGDTIGCYSNRYATLITEDGAPLERSFGLSHWRSLSDMERWSESHPTHVRIFGTFMDIVQTLQGKLDLRLYHEVAVLRSDQQSYEYLNCHPRTGLLTNLKVGNP